MEKPQLPNSFWITNVSKTDVCLGDLSVTVRAHSSVNLLDKKHYPYLTLEMIQKSGKSGSLFKRSNKIFHRKFPPIQEETKRHVKLDTVSYIPTRQHSIIEIEEKKYDELDIVEDDIISNISGAPDTKE